MSNVAKNAILKAKLSGVVHELMIKTNTENVMFDDSTTLAQKLTEMLASLSGKAESSAVTTAIDQLRKELMGEGVPEAYDTFKELADYIETHKEVSGALSAAIGKKADKATTLAGYGITDAYTSTQTDEKIAAAVKSATGGESAATVKAELDAYKTSNDAKIEDLTGKAHDHSNKVVLDGISAESVAGWNGKAKMYFSATEPEGLTENDLWVQIVT